MPYIDLSGYLLLVILLLFISAMVSKRPAVLFGISGCFAVVTIIAGVFVK